MADDRGRFVWYELLTTDPAAAEKFYKAVVGWETSTFEGAGQPYTMWMAGETPIGGILEKPDAAKKAGPSSQWLGYVDVPDVDATAKRARELGAKVHVEPRDIPNVGRFSVFDDPQGATIAVHRSFSALQPEAPPRPGQISWHELGTTDVDAAWRFYEELFGWRKQQAMDMGPAGLYQMYGRGDTMLGGMYRVGPEMPAPPHWLYYALVDDVHAGAERVKANGGKVVNGPMEVPGGSWIVVFTDPQGGMSALHSQPKPA